MSIAIPLQTPRRELAHRANGGLEITLFWNADDDTTSIEVWHPETEETITFDVPRNQALDASTTPLPISPPLRRPRATRESLASPDA